MSEVRRAELPEHALLHKYLRNGSFTDCYVSELNRQVSFADYVTAFYTTRLFKAERLILKWLIKKPSTDAQARQVAEGATSEWAAWTVEERTANQLLLCDHQGRTRSWFMTETSGSAGNAQTLLYFGSAVLSKANETSGEAEMGMSFRALMGFHHWYSVALLKSAITALPAYSARLKYHE